MGRFLCGAPKHSLGRAAKGIVLAFLMFAFIPAAEGASKDTKALCASCHPKAASFTLKKNVHQPVRLGLCTSCHNPHASSHDALLSGDPSAICYSCHDRRRGFTGAVVHKPAGEGKCLDCHDPHASDSRGLLKATGAEMCYSCHKKEDVISKKNAHPEVAKGNCLVCHKPHASSEEGLLSKKKADICKDCHKPVGEKFAVAHGNYPMAGGGDCLECHNPHSSDLKGMTRAFLHAPFKEKMCEKCHVKGSDKVVSAGTELCIQCHNGALSSFNGIYSHLVRSSERFCDDCHSPHASDRKALLNGRESSVCYACHMDSKERSNASKHVHKKIGACLDCHVSHGSNNRYFLAKGADTCAAENCHPTQGTFTHPVGEAIIDPRNKAPMDCNTCHNVMGSPEKMLLRADPNVDLCVQCHQT